MSLLSGIREDTDVIIDELEVTATRSYNSSVSYANDGKETITWTSGGSISGVFQPEKGSYKIEDSGEDIEYEAIFFCAYDETVNKGDKLTIDSKVYYVIDIDSNLEHKKLYLTGYEEMK